MSILHRMEHADQALNWRGDMPTMGLYTVGVAGERFLRGIKDEGRFFASVCPDCDLTYMPPRLYCEQCFAYLDDWTEVQPVGRVHTYTVLHWSLDGEPLPTPRIMAFIHLEGTDGGLVHNLDEVEPDQVYIGMRVEAVLKGKGDRQGSINDVRYFRPTE